MDQAFGSDRDPYWFSFEAAPIPSNNFRGLQTDTNSTDVAGRDLAYTISINILVFFTVAGISSVVDYEEFKASFRKPAIYAGACFQFFLMPLVGFITVFIFPLQPLEAIALIILCASPGGAFSNWWCNLFNGDLALSVSMTSLSTVASIGMLPFNIFLYIQVAYTNVKGNDNDDVEVNFEDLGITLVLVILAIIMGLAFGIRYPHLQRYSNVVGNVAGMASILLGVFASTDVEEGEQPWDQDIYPLWIGTAVPLIVGLVGTFVLSGFLGLYKQQRVSIALETAYQNTGIALAYTLSQGAEGRRAAAVPVIYGGYEAGFFGLFMLFAWQMNWTYAPARPVTDILRVMFDNYQPGSENFHKYFDENHKWREVPLASSRDLKVVADDSEDSKDML